MNNREFIEEIEKDFNFGVRCAEKVTEEFRENFRIFNDECFNNLLHEDDFNLYIYMISESSFSPKLELE